MALREKLAEQFAGGHADMQALDAKVAPSGRSRWTPSGRTQFDADRVRMTESLADVETRFNNTEGDSAKPAQQRRHRRAPARLPIDIVAVATGLSGLTQELALIKARARLESVTIPLRRIWPRIGPWKSPAPIGYDWMNNRASLVDTWRLIAFNANALKAGLGSDFQRRLGHGRQQSGGLQRAERQPARGLAVRRAVHSPAWSATPTATLLITYQQTRRSLYQYQDGVNFTLRSSDPAVGAVADQHGDPAPGRGDRDSPRRQDARGLEQAAGPARPTTPGQPAEPVETLGPTVASEPDYGPQRLAGAQNNFMSVVLNHYETRMLLYRELGIMELDDCGMWIDKPINEADWLTRRRMPDAACRFRGNGWRMPASTCATCTRARPRSLPTRRTARPKPWPSEPPAESPRTPVALRNEDLPRPWGKAIRPSRRRMRTRKRRRADSVDADVVQRSRRWASRKGGRRAR